MGRRVRVKAIRREKPDIRLYVQALLALTQEVQEAEQQAAKTSDPAGADPVRQESASEADDD